MIVPDFWHLPSPLSTLYAKDFETSLDTILLAVLNNVRFGC
jgi:hypothetical protein